MRRIFIEMLPGILTGRCRSSTFRSGQGMIATVAHLRQLAEAGQLLPFRDRASNDEEPRPLDGLLLLLRPADAAAAEEARWGQREVLRACRSGGAW